MEYRGFEIDEYMIYPKEELLKCVESNPAFFTGYDFQLILKKREEMIQGLRSKGIRWEQMQFRIDSSEKSYDEDFTEIKCEGCTEIYLVWDEIESESQREARINAEKLRIDKLLSDIARKLDAGKSPSGVEKETVLSDEKQKAIDFAVDMLKDEFEKYSIERETPEGVKRVLDTDALKKDLASKWRNILDSENK